MKQPWWTASLSSTSPGSHLEKPAVLTASCKVKTQSKLWKSPRLMGKDPATSKLSLRSRGLSEANNVQGGKEAWQRIQRTRGDTGPRDSTE